MRRALAIIALALAVLSSGCSDGGVEIPTDSQGKAAECIGYVYVVDQYRGTILIEYPVSSWDRVSVEAETVRWTDTSNTWYQHRITESDLVVLSDNKKMVSELIPR